MGFEHSASEIEMNVETDGVENVQKMETEDAKLLDSDDSDSSSAIGFFEAWMLPEVAAFSSCLFFSEMVAYTFLYWLPFYIRHTAVAGVLALMFLSSFLVNGLYALITTVMAADLGTQTLNQGNSRALATVTAIIDGIGFVGAALGPLLAGYISTRGWNSVFFMLILSIFLAGLFLVRVARTEIRDEMNAGK